MYQSREFKQETFIDTMSSTKIGNWRLENNPKNVIYYMSSIKFEDTVLRLYNEGFFYEELT